MEITPDTLKNKRILVVGLARSGTGAANLLSSFGARVAITDLKSASSLKADIKRLDPSVEVITGDNPEHLFTESDLIVVSPGIPLSIPPIVKAMEQGISVIGELELAFQVAARDKLSPHHVSTEHPEDKSLLKTQSGSSVETPSADLSAETRKPLFIGVTGTNGKSTTTTLIDLMLKRSGFRTLMGGNIGNALTEELGKLNLEGEGGRVDYIVAEISSFQLESIREFRPKVATILNITSDHLDRYRDLEEYIKAKARIFENQKAGDCLILNADDPAVERVKKENLEVKNSKPTVLYFSRKKKVDGIYFKDGMLYLNSSSFKDPVSHFPFLSHDDIGIEGLHNLENSMAASAVAFVSGCSQQAVTDVLRNFHGLEHRLESVKEFQGIKFINDSKGTNIGAVRKSLEGLDSVVLIMGGQDKGGDFQSLRKLIAGKVKALVLLGESKEKISEAVGDVTERLIVNDMKEAVKAAVSRASEGDVVLLSPGCASFDMFADFEERGRKFKEAVREISK